MRIGLESRDFLANSLCQKAYRKSHRPVKTIDYELHTVTALELSRIVQISTNVRTQALGCEIPGIWLTYINEQWKAFQNHWHYTLLYRVHLAEPILGRYDA